MLLSQLKEATIVENKNPTDSSTNFDSAGFFYTGWAVVQGIGKTGLRSHSNGKGHSVRSKLLSPILGHQNHLISYDVVQPGGGEDFNPESVPQIHGHQGEGYRKICVLLQTPA